MALDPYADIIADMVRSGNTYRDISNHLQRIGKGSSEANIRKFCREVGINPRGGSLTNMELEAAVENAVDEVGPSYGRKMMTGYLKSKGLGASEVRVGKTLRAVHEPYQTARQQGTRNLNPIPYTAQYFGHKLHMDQNEKLGMFGATHVLAVDGYSGKVVAWKSMPVKNNLIIYDSVYRSATLAYGMWDQVRVDNGTEFYLSLYMQEINAHLRNNSNRQPYMQTQSKRNHKIERMWPEVNQRVNYPIKAALVELMDVDAVNVEDDVSKFCLSNLCIQLAELGIQQVVESWNAHRIPGKGIPNVLSQLNMAASVQEVCFPPAAVAAENYRRDLGNVLTSEANFGRDPFTADCSRLACEAQFRRDTPPLSYLLSRATHGDYRPLQEAVVKLINLTNRFS